MSLKNKSKISYIIVGLFFLLIVITLICLLSHIYRNKKLANKVYTVAETSGTTISNTPVDTTHYTLDTLKNGVSQAEANSFFNNAIFIGDSVTLGFERFHNNRLGNLTVFGIGKYGIADSLRPLDKNPLHPLYEGQPIQIWNLVKKIKAKKVFLMFGLNDIGLYGVKDSLTNYQTLISAIKEHNPRVQIYIVSTTPVTKNYKGKLDNNNIRQFNNYMRVNAETLGITYIDIASYLIDEDGYLKDELCSDGQFHLEDETYDQWIEILSSFASYNLK